MNNEILLGVMLCVLVLQLILYRVLHRVLHRELPTIDENVRYGIRTLLNSQSTNNTSPTDTRLLLKYQCLDNSYDTITRIQAEAHRYSDTKSELLNAMPGRKAYVDGYVDGLMKASNVVVDATANTLGIDQSEVRRHLEYYEL